MFCTTVEATKGEQLKVIRWQYKPETKLLAGRWVPLAAYLTVSLDKAPRRLAAQPWVLELQQRQNAAAQLAEAYQTGACFTGDHSYQPRVRGIEEILAQLVESQEDAALDELLDLTVEVVPYAGVDVSTDGEQVHRDVGEVLNQQGCVVHTEPGRIFSIEEKESK
jgi:hypothetical protein